MDKNEFELIDLIEEKIEKRKCRTDGVGIGDDCAVLSSISSERDVLVTTDALVEGVHFDLSYCSFYDVGYKAAIANVSDIIAKNAKPLSAFISLAIPNYISSSEILLWYDGFLEVASGFKISVSGGDTTRSKNGFFISITMIGVAEKNEAILRSNAKPKEGVYLLGRVGESVIGFDRLQSGKYDRDDPCVVSHLRPSLFYKQWLDLTQKYKIGASIDISDGLLQDASHIAKLSKVTINIFANSNWQMVSCEYNKNRDTERLNFLKKILSGGEDYSILFTSVDSIPEQGSLIRIGEVTEGLPEVLLVDENASIIEVSKKGFSHF